MRLVLLMLVFCIIYIRLMVVLKWLGVMRWLVSGYMMVGISEKFMLIRVVGIYRF